MTRDDVIWLLRFYGRIDREIRGARELRLSRDEQERYERELTAAKGEISRALLELPYKERDAVFSHYALGRKWSQIRCRHNYSDKQIRNISNRGLLALGKRLEDSEPVRQFLRRREEDTLL